jgi:protein-arginine kinase activator protein McsA
MNCPFCDAPATVHITFIRDGEKFHCHVCEQHIGAADDGSAKPITDIDEKKRQKQHWLDLAVSHPEAFEVIRKAFPQILDDTEHGGTAP